MREEIDFIRDLLDKQLVDSEDTRMGRADGVVMTVDDDGPPKIDHLELGFAVLARRIHPRVEKWLQALRKRWSPRRSARQVVPWSKVIDVNDHEIKLDLKAIETPAFDWERWCRRIVAKIPGSGQE